jgi:exodeoxyribonuclease VII large subunit
MDVGVARRLEHHRTQLGHLAARLPVPARMIPDLQLRADDLQLRLERSMRRTTARQTLRLQAAHGSLRRRSPRQAVTACAARLTGARHGLLAAMRSRHRMLTAALHAGAAALNALNPLAVLERGYSIVRRRPSMAVVRTAAHIAPGDSLHIQFSAGSAVCRVTQCTPGHP